MGLLSGSGRAGLRKGDAERLEDRLEHEAEVCVLRQQREKMIEDRQSGLDVRRAAPGLHADAAPTPLRAHALASGHPALRLSQPGRTRLFSYTRVRFKDGPFGP